MNPVNELHQEAMALAEKAHLARLQGSQLDCDSLLREAFEKECEAANLMASEFNVEPSRSILHRSAATLALECGELKQAEKIITRALSGNPPEEIAEELRDLLEQVYFGRHLSLRGIVLDPGELRMSLAGRATGYGITLSDPFVNMVTITQKILQRFAERILGRPFRERGSPPKELRERFELFLSVPERASFAITFKIGRQKELPFPGVNYVNKVLDEFMNCIELVGEDDAHALKNMIPDVSYFNNFIGLSKKLIPDGSSVSLVGFTTMAYNRKREVALTTRKLKGRPIAQVVEEITEGQSPTVSVAGRLKYADSTLAEPVIQLIEEKTGEKHRIIVPPGMMGDIVKPLWEDMVLVKGIRSGKKVLLEEIEKIE